VQYTISPHDVEEYAIAVFQEEVGLKSGKGLGFYFKLSRRQDAAATCQASLRHFSQLALISARLSFFSDGGS